MRHNPSVSPFLLIVATLLIGCAAVEYVPSGPPKVLTVQEVRDGVTSNSKKISTLKAKAKITFMSSDLKDPLNCTGYIRLERPKRLRIICSKLFSTIFDVVSNGNEFWLYVPKEKKLYHGRSDQDIRYLGLRFSPNEIAGILENGEVFRDSTVTSFEVHPEHWHIELTNPQELTQHHLVVDRYNINLVRYETYNPDGTLRMKALFDDFEDVDGCHVPKRIEVYWPRGNTSLIIQLTDISLNEELNPDIFRFTEPENVEIIRLSRGGEPSYLRIGAIIPVLQPLSTARTEPSTN
ncbi:MAG TPA: LolA family protein [Candidatus Avalokitesvara rifleensis]|uniref:LolA family protein n=1 Tax=Candidatus Avalokitesvara rifleensis TaxID=3367620 RepID=UPI0027123B36|nr:DUF4292 domain-containing protein [Candidatus Brocadiales bacterium]